LAQVSVVRLRPDAMRRSGSLDAGRPWLLPQGTLYLIFWATVATVRAVAALRAERCEVSQESALLQHYMRTSSTLSSPSTETASSSSTAAAASSTGAETVPQGPSSFEQELFQLITDIRRVGFTCPDGTHFAPNEKPFLFDCRLWKAARLWSEEMASSGFFGDDRGSSSPCSRTEDQGFPKGHGCGETVAVGKKSPEAAMKVWQESLNAHCGALMNPEANRCGIGFVEEASAMYRFYWTQSLGSDTNEVDTSCLVDAAAHDSDTSPASGGAGSSTSSSPPQSSLDEVCTDTSKLCGLLRRRCHLEKYSAWMGENCRSTCGLCP